MKNVISFLFFLILLHSSAYGQKPTKGVGGYVLEKTDTGKSIPIFGAAVYIPQIQKGTTTDSLGKFVIACDTFPVKLVVSYIGLQNDTIWVYKPNSVLNIYLSTITELQAVEISVERENSFFQTMNPISTQIITEGELKKAACCNLSESFETNPSIDANFADAVTGIKQIQMLGLSGIYAPVTTELVPITKGLASHQGLTYIPGPWIESIQVTKGIGPVSNGYESISGQINVELKKPDKADALYANAYYNQMGRWEANVLSAGKISKKWSTALMSHYSELKRDVDMNMDNFMDLPKGKQINLFHRWKYLNEKGTILQAGLKAIFDTKDGGSMLGGHGGHSIGGFQPSRFAVSGNANRIEGFVKTGFLLKGKNQPSLGIIAQSYRQMQDWTIGYRSYTGQQDAFSLQALYEQEIKNPNHKIKAGYQFQLDKYNEVFTGTSYNRTESVHGLFAEYTWKTPILLDIVSGIRYDKHNLFGDIITPRLHIKYDIAEMTTLRLSGGRGQRTASIFSENLSLFANNRFIYINGKPGNNRAYGLLPEIAWNYGGNLIHKFKVFNRPGSLIADFYRTDFMQQVVVDMDLHSQALYFYNLEGSSYSNSSQIELNYDPIKRLNVKTALRYFDVKTTYHGKLLQKPLQAAWRAFFSASYSTRSLWQFDFTANYISSKRIPNTEGNPPIYRWAKQSPAYTLLHGQIQKKFNLKTPIEIYIGVENALNVRQNPLIISASNPDSSVFDSSIIWGPVIGRMFYGGFRWNLPSFKNHTETP